MKINLFEISIDVNVGVDPKDIVVVLGVQWMVLILIVQVNVTEIRFGSKLQVS